MTLGYLWNIFWNAGLWHYAQLSLRHQFWLFLAAHVGCIVKYFTLSVELDVNDMRLLNKRILAACPSIIFS